jgi:hypothetical protein
MRTQIQKLSDEEAVIAVRYFYDASPPEIWEGGHKPSPERVRTIAAGLREKTPADIRPVVEGILDDYQRSDSAARATICRALLDHLSQSPTMLPSVETAIAKAREVHMVIDPITGAFILALLVLSTRTETKPDGSYITVPGGGIAEIISSLRLPEMLEKLPAVIKTLPTEAVSKLLAKFGLP